MNEKCHGKLVHKQYITGDTSEKKGTDHENRFKKIQWIADRYISSLFMSLYYHKTLFFSRLVFITNKV